MLMFQNGLLTTFIPEILMVIGYVLFLFAPGVKSNDTSVDQGSVVVHVSTFEYQKQISAYQVSIHDFQPVEFVSSKKEIIPPFVEKAIIFTTKSHFSSSDSLSYVDFSRPPPALLS